MKIKYYIFISLGPTHHQISTAVWIDVLSPPLRVCVSVCVGLSLSLSFSLPPSLPPQLKAAYRASGTSELTSRCKQRPVPQARQHKKSQRPPVPTANMAATATTIETTAICTLRSYTFRIICTPRSCTFRSHSTSSRSCTFRSSHRICNTCSCTSRSKCTMCECRGGGSARLLGRVLTPAQPHHGPYAQIKRQPRAA